MEKAEELLEDLVILGHELAGLGTVPRPAPLEERLAYAEERLREMLARIKGVRYELKWGDAEH